MIRKHADLFVLLIALMIFWTATFYQIRLPGLYYDEAADVAPAMQIVQGGSDRLDMVQSITPGPLRVPVMVMVYVGAVSTYAVLPLYWLFGVGVETTRAMTILFASLGMIFSFLFLKELFDRRVATLTVLLMAVHPAFVFWSRQGIFVSSPMLTMAAASLWCLLRWRRRGEARYLYAALFLAGLGISTKLLFLWFIIAVCVASLLLGLIPRFQVGRRLIGQDKQAPVIALRTAVIACAWFVAGAWMIIYYNLTTGDTIRFMLRNVLTTGAGVNNLDVLTNLRKVFSALIMMIDSSWFQHLWGPAFVNRLFPVVFFASLGLLLVFLVRRSLPWPWRRVAFVILYAVLIWVQSAFTITGLGAAHLYILCTFVPALIVLAALALAARFRQPLFAAVTIALILVSDGWTVMDHHRQLSESGGIRAFSDVIYQVTADLEQHRGPVAAADWGFRYNIAVLSNGRVWPDSVFGFSAGGAQAEFAERIRPYLARSDAWILFHSPAHTAFPGRFEAAARLAAEMKRKLVLDRTYYQRDGTETIYIYRTEPLE